MHKIHILYSLFVTQAVSMLFGVTSYAEEHIHRQHGAHEHGVVQLNIAQEGKRLLIELNSPAMNMVGFEHTPRSAQERHAVQQAVATLKQAGQLFVMSPAADCQSISVVVDSPLLADGHKTHEAHHGHDDDSVHAEFSAEYVFECQQMSALTTMQVKLFSKFPATKDVDVTLLTEKGQRALELNAQQTHVDF